MSKVIDLLESIKDEIQRGNQSSRLMTVSDVAFYLGMSKASVSNRVINCPTFPPAIRIPSGNSVAHPRWEGAKVKAWAKRYEGVR